MKLCLWFLDLLRGEAINVGYSIFENIKNMANTAQEVCGHLCVINKLCMRTGVPTYQDDEMIVPNAPSNASTIMRLQHDHPVGAT